MTAVAFRVAHAPWTSERRMLLLQLVKRLGRVAAPHTFKVIEDAKREGCWPTLRRAWIDGIRDPKATHVMAMQDDIHPCPSFIPTIEKLIGMRPEAPMAFWTARNTVERVEGAWMATACGASGGGTIMPRAMAADFIRWNDTYLPQRDDDKFAEDCRMAWYFFTHGVTLYYPIPGLMYHYGEKSLLGHNSINRAIKPRRFIGLDGDPLAVDWTDGFDNPPMSRNLVPKFGLPTLSREVLVASGLGRVYPVLLERFQEAT